jgi:hypothetical protein
MPMLGVMRAILDDECGSTSGDEAFFSVARTMPFVAAASVLNLESRRREQTFDAEGCYAVVDDIEGILDLDQLAAAGVSRSVEVSSANTLG